MTTSATRSPRRRTVVALAVILAILAAFTIRLIDIQVVNAADHVADAREKGLEKSATLFGTRGDIVDTHGSPLATSRMLYDLKIDPMLAAEGIYRRDADGNVMVDENREPIMIPFSEVAERIANVTGQSADEIRTIVDEALTDNPNSRYAMLKRYASTAMYRELVDLGLPFVSADPHPSRVYPDGAVAGNLVGFTGADGTALEGIEALYDDCLSAQNGEVVYQRAAHGGVVIPGTEEEIPAVDGGTVALTIDRDLQWYMQQLISEETAKLNANFGGIMVVEVKTGKIRALAESSTVDPNDVGASDPQDRGSRLLRYSYEPGSTFKPVTAATAIEQGGATPMTAVTVPDRKVYPNGAVINDSEKHATQNLTLTGGLVTSSNVAMSEFGEMVPKDVREDYLRKFGVASKNGLGWSGEPATVLRPASEWDNQTFYTTTFGQAFTVTVPQVASVYQTFANDGLRLPLTLVESCTADDGTVTQPKTAEPEQVVKKETAEQVSLMLENVFAQGTLAEDIAIDGYRMAGKTGTAQVSNGAGGYKKGVFFTSLVGYAPAEDPEYVVLTVYDEPKKGGNMSSVNRSVFKKAMTQVLTHYRVQPSESTTPLLPVTK